MSRYSKPQQFNAASFVLGLCLTIGGCLSFDDGTPVPSDDELIKSFNENKQTFDQLSKSILEDDYLLVGRDPLRTDPKNLPVPKLHHYYELLKKIEAKSVQREGAYVNIRIWSRGFAGDGDEKGFTFRPTNMHESTKRLDNFKSKGKPEYLLRDIGDGWFLYYEHIP